MNYMDIIRGASTDTEVSFISLATTGIKKDDKIIAVFVGKESGPIVSMAQEGITAEELEATYKYHRISKYMYDNMLKVNSSVMYNSISNFSNNDILVTYNPEFVKSMVGRLQIGGYPPEVIDICKICQWVRSGQIFSTASDATLGHIMGIMSGWNSAQKYGIKAVLKDLVPEYSEDLSKPTPEAMVEALRCLCKFLERQPVRISQAV